ncbi:hypothetical protein WJX72_003679 [[Myrmecia] bisecta]|uniref:Uncharacterized protein n=1 Tax=[Myrmecia] bisecta TaxID=41462 RepID=A0AAW1R645_9CHLO
MGPMVDDIVKFARLQSQAQPDQALDVLRSGLSMQGDSPAGLAAGRLHLVMAEIEAERSNWNNAAERADSAAKASSATEPGEEEKSAVLQAVARGLCTRVLLSAGRDEEAVDYALNSRVEDNFMDPVSMLEDLASTTLVRHAMAPLEDEEMATVHMQLDVLQGIAMEHGEASVANAAKCAANVRLSMGQTSEADSMFGWVQNTAEAAGQSPEQQAAVVSPQRCAEIRADALLGRAQAAIFMKEWQQAEDLLSQGLTAAEAVGGENHPRLSMVLSLLATVFARTQRVTMAEGLYRNAAKLIKLDPSQAKPTANGVHSSVAAMIAWQHAQLLTVLPKREKEAQEWADCARAHFRQSLSLEGDIETVFGSLEALRGGDKVFREVVVDLSTRRIFDGMEAGLGDAPPDELDGAA